MSKIDLWQAAFNTGELTGLLEGREDLEKYPNGCRKLRNFHGIIQGPARRRTGSYRAALTKSNGVAWLLPFIKGRTTAYMIELGETYARFYKERGVVESGGSPYEIVTPWSLSDLTDDDGSFKLRYVQSNDVIYIFGADGIKQINHFSDTDWTITDFDTVGGPFDAENITSTTVYASAATGSVTLTASSSIFTSDHIGSLILLRPEDLSVVPPWEANRVVTTNALRRSDGKTYKQTTAGVLAGTNGQRHSGTVAPIHEKGTASDGSGGNGDSGSKIVDTYDGSGRVDTGYEWEFQDPGYGILKITAVASGVSATATVQVWQLGATAQLPSAVVGSANATTAWAWGLFSDANGWPVEGKFFRDRFVLAGPRSSAFSVPSSYDQFVMETAGEVLADNAFVVNFQSNRDEEIRWMLVSGNALHIGTTGGEHTITEMTQQQVFGPENRKIDPQTAYGSNGVIPVLAGETPLFVDASGLRVRAIEPAEISGRYNARSQNDLAEHITASGIIQTTWAALPDSLLWGMRNDGRLACFTFSHEQDVYGWSLHDIGGYRDASQLQGAKVLSVASIPSPDGTIDDVWMIVERYVNGATQRSVEYFTPVIAPPEKWENETSDGFERRMFDHQADMFFVDGGVTYDNPLTITDISESSGTLTVTIASHGLSNGDEVRIDEVIGMYEVNARSFTIENVTANTFDLADIDGSDYTTYVSDGVARELVDTITVGSGYEGETLQILADGAVHPSRIVSGGDVTLQFKAGRVHLGWGFKSVLETERPSGGNPQGSAQGKTGIINNLIIRFYNSLGGSVGPNNSMQDYLELRVASDPMGLPPPLFSGDFETGWPDGFSTDRTVMFIQDQPLPTTIVAFGIHQEVNV